MAGIGQLHGAGGAQEECGGELLLEPPDLIADGGRCDPQLLSRPGETQMSRRGLEGLQTAEIGEASGHGVSSSKSHKSVKELSFARAMPHHHNKGEGSFSSRLFERTPYG